MKLKHLFIANAVASLIDGGGSVLFPSAFLALSGVPDPTPQTLVMTQAFGAALLSYGLVAWLARNAQDSEARRAILLSFFITFAIAFVVTARAVLAGVMGPACWISAAMYAVFAAGYAYFHFRREAV